MNRIDRSTAQRSVKNRKIPNYGRKSSRTLVQGIIVYDLGDRCCCSGHEGWICIRRCSTLKKPCIGKKVEPYSTKSTLRRARTRVDAGSVLRVLQVDGEMTRREHARGTYPRLLVEDTDSVCSQLVKGVWDPCNRSLEGSSLGVCAISGFEISKRSVGSKGPLL